MRNKRGQFIKGSKPSENCVKAIKEHWLNTPKKRITKRCENCMLQFKVYPYRTDAKFCSGSCRSLRLGKTRRQNAIPILLGKYMFIKIPSYHRSNKMGYAKIADLVLEQKLGRLLKKNEIAHHIDECKTNDAPSNLVVMTKLEHDKFHTTKRWEQGNFR